MGGGMYRENLKKELEKFLSEKDGLYYLSDRIAYYNITVKNVKILYGIGPGSIITTYTLCVIYKDGKISDPVQVKYLDKISLFAL